MDLGRSSSPDITVAPVVVKPETDSNNAFIKFSCSASESIRGKAPKVLNTSQKNTVTIKPSRVRSSPLLFREGNQNAMPTSRVMAKADKKVEEVFSLNSQPTKIGVSMVRLKIISSMPRTRAITAICIVTYVLEKGEANSKQLLDSFGVFFIDHKHNNVVIILNDGVMMGNNYLTIAHQCRQCSARW